MEKCQAMAEKNQRAAERNAQKDKLFHKTLKESLKRQTEGSEDVQALDKTTAAAAANFATAHKRREANKAPANKVRFGRFWGVNWFH